MAIIIDIINEDEQIVGHRGLLNGTLFIVPDGSLDERHGWHRVTMSQAAFAALEAKILEDLASLKGFWLS